MDNKQEKTYAGMTRRTLCLGAGGAAVMLGLGGLKYAGSQPLVRPPGGQDEERLISACIRCEKCYEICPRDVIAPAHLEDGVLNMRTPTFDFSANWCDWCAEEHDGTPLCVSACPTEALKLPDDATAENTIIGKAVINTDWCLAYKLIGCPVLLRRLSLRGHGARREQPAPSCRRTSATAAARARACASRCRTAHLRRSHRARSSSDPLDEVEG